MNAYVLKFGSSVLAGGDGFRAAVGEIRRYVEWPTLVIVSAVAGTTDALLASAAALAVRPDPAHVARLLATGEDAAARLLAIALADAGIDATVCAAAECRIRTAGPTLDAEPIDVDVDWLDGLVVRPGVTVIPGFVGRGSDGSLSLLGRGGSDMTAVFLGQRIRASCVLFKDVDGLYTTDPADDANGARRFREATWDDVARLGSRLVQTKAVRYAESRGFGFVIAKPNGGGTLIGPGPSVLETPRAAVLS